MMDTPPPPSQGQLLIYQDGALNLQVRLDGQTVWLTQAAIAELYQTTPQNITIHLKSIYDEGELPETATCKDYLQVRAEGTRQVQRTLKHYNLDVILAIGYRVRSQRGTLFRQWATSRLRELLVKGFTLDDQRLKAGQTIGADYFDELHVRGQFARYDQQRRGLEAQQAVSDFDQAVKGLAAPTKRRRRKKDTPATDDGGAA